MKTENIEINQDGGDHEGSNIYNYRNEVIRICETIIAKEFLK